MENFDRILDLLKEKLEIFLTIEKLTNMMFTSSVDELSDILADRGDLLQKAVLIESEINKEVYDKACIKGVLNNTKDISKLSDELLKIYDASMRVKAVLNRLNKLEKDVQLRLENERDMILERIESMNSSSNSVAGNYKRTVQMGFPQFSLLDKEKSI